MKLRPDLVIADISLPTMSGLDLIKELRRTAPDVPTLVLSMHPAAQFARRALKAGAAGYLTKDTAPGASVCEGDCLTNWPALAVAADGSVAAGETKAWSMGLASLPVAAIRTATISGVTCRSEWAYCASCAS